MACIFAILSNEECQYHMLSMYRRNAEDHPQWRAISRSPSQEPSFQDTQQGMAEKNGKSQSCHLQVNRCSQKHAAGIISGQQNRTSSGRHYQGTSYPLIQAQIIEPQARNFQALSSKEYCLMLYKRQLQGSMATATVCTYKNAETRTRLQTADRTKLQNAVSACRWHLNNRAAVQICECHEPRAVISTISASCLNMDRYNNLAAPDNLHASADMGTVKLCTGHPVCQEEGPSATSKSVACLTARLRIVFLVTDHQYPRKQHGTAPPPPDSLDRALGTRSQAGP